MEKKTRRRPALERAVATANRLFYEEGIHAVGVDRITTEADVSKATIYTHFASKDDLVVNYLRDRSQQWQDHVAVELPQRTDDPRESILAVFDLLGEWFVLPGYRGCPFINAEAENGTDHATHLVTLEHRRWVRELFLGRLEQLGCTDREFVALQLVELYDGCMVGAQSEPERPWAAAARAGAAAVTAA